MHRRTTRGLIATTSGLTTISLATMSGCVYNNYGFPGWNDPNVHTRTEVFTLNADEAAAFDITTRAGDISVTPHDYEWPSWANTATDGAVPAGEVIVVAQLGTTDELKLENAVLEPWSSDGATRFKTDWGANDGIAGATRIAIRTNQVGAVTAETGSGDVRVLHADGDIDINTGSGDITVFESSGSLLADAGSGKIRVAEHDGPVDLDTGSGDITCTLNGHAETVRISAGSGDVRAEGLTGAATIKTGSGEIKAHLSDNFDQNAGPVNLRAGSGDITIYHHPQVGFVWRIDTGSGSIDIDRNGEGARRYDADSIRLGDDGPLIDIRTGSGDVEVRTP